MLNLAEYKRRQAAPGVKVTLRNFGRDRRYPIINRFRDPGTPLPEPDPSLVKASARAAKRRGVRFLNVDAAVTDQFARHEGRSDGADWWLAVGRCACCSGGSAAGCPSRRRRRGAAPLAPLPLCAAAPAWPRPLRACRRWSRLRQRLARSSVTTISPRSTRAVVEVLERVGPGLARPLAAAGRIECLAVRRRRSAARYRCCPPIETACAMSSPGLRWRRARPRRPGTCAGRLLVLAETRRRRSRTRSGNSSRRRCARRRCGKRRRCCRRTSARAGTIGPPPNRFSKKPPLPPRRGDCGIAGRNRSARARPGRRGAGLRGRRVCPAAAAGRPSCGRDCRASAGSGC